MVTALYGENKEILINTEAKIGATAGWVLGGGAVNTGEMATCPASKTASTLVVPVMGLRVNDVIVGFSVNGQIESAGAAATLDADLRAMTIVAGANTDASIGTIAQVSITADTAVASEKTGLSEVVSKGKTYYVLLTATTAALTDIVLSNITVTTSGS